MGRKLLGIALASTLALSSGLLSSTGAAHATTRPLPRLTVGNVSVAEGDSGTIALQVPVDLSWSSTATLKVKWAITGGTATAGSDFFAATKGSRQGILTFRPGTLEGKVNVKVFGDTTAEPDETLFVTITSAPGATIANGQGTVTIVNDDVAASHLGPRAASAPGPRVIVGTPVQWEGNGAARSAIVPVALSTPATSTVTVRFSTGGTVPTDGDGVDEDCHDTHGWRVSPSTFKVTFQAGQQSKNVVVAVNGNTLPDPTVSFVGDVTVLVSGTVAVPQVSSDIVVLDDDSGSPLPPAPLPVGVSRISEPWDGSNPTFPPKVRDTSIGCGYPQSGSPSVSADGRYVVFDSNADNLVPYDTNGENDVFVKDTWTGAVQLISQGPDGSGGNNWSYAESISADGRFVTFVSDATNLVPNDNDGWYDSFLYDRDTDTMTRLVGTDPRDHGTRGATISDDDRYVAYFSLLNVSGGGSGVYVLDRNTGVASLIAGDLSGPISWADWPTISGDGRHVAFSGAGGLYVKDLDTGAIEQVSVDNNGTNIGGSAGGISDDGNVVLFDTNTCPSGQVVSPCAGDFVRDRAAHTTTYVGQAQRGTVNSVALSHDGRSVTFIDIAATASCSGGDFQAQVKRMDVASGTITRVDTGGNDPCLAGPRLSNTHQVSEDGNYVVFTGRYSCTCDVSATSPETVFIRRLQ